MSPLPNRRAQAPWITWRAIKLLAAPTLRAVLLVLVALLVLPARAAERAFDFSKFPLGETPPGFRSAVSGSGKLGDWRIIMDEVTPLLPSLNPQAPVVTKRAVLAQLAQDPADEHFPLLIYEDESFSDFVLTTRFKTVKGVKEQMAGIAFRIQDPTNYYVVRASSLGNTFRFYKVVNGERGAIVGPDVAISAGVWHDLRIECKGTEIRAFLDGKDLIPPLGDNTFARGRIGFWTKSDSVSYFADTKIEFTPREMPAQVLLRAMLKKYPKLLGMQIYVLHGEPKAPRLVASKNEAEVGQSGGAVELDVIGHGTPYYGKESKSVSVVMALRDRNGDPVGAVRLILKPAIGQSEQNAFSRAMPIVRDMQERIQTLQDLVE